MLSLEVVTQSVGREISDSGWERIEPIHIRVWREMERCISADVVSHEGINLSIKANFRSAINYLQDRFDRTKRFSLEKDQDAFDGFGRTNRKLKFKIIPQDDFSNFRHNDVESVVEYIIYEMFLAMNLAAPGSCNLDQAYLVRRPANKNIYKKEIRSDIRLSNRFFESAIYESEDRKWLRIKEIDLQKVIRWIKNVCPRFSMISENPSAKALFSLQHLSRNESGPDSIIWVFYGLESLFQCKPGENFNSLIKRISALLNLNEVENDQLRKRMRELYDLRSAFVHGGHKVVHCLQNEGLDERAADGAWKYIVDSDFGSAVLISCLQNLIDRGWQYPTFEENMSGFI